jgi:hypothetical protein
MKLDIWKLTEVYSFCHVVLNALLVSALSLKMSCCGTRPSGGTDPKSPGNTTELSVYGEAVPTVDARV